MLTTKNSGTLAAGLMAAVLVSLASGCQPSGPKALLLGEKSLRQRDFPKALKHFARAAETMPEQPRVWNRLGLAYHGLGQAPRALESYQRALRIDRNFAPGHFNLGVLLLEQERLPEAIYELETYVKLEPGHSEGWLRLGVALLRARKLDEAERALRQSLRLDPKNPEAQNNFGVLQARRKRPREAMQAFHAALQIQPGYGPALLNLAVVTQEHLANPGLALERYRAYLNTQPLAESRARVEAVVRDLERALSPPPRELAAKPGSAPTSGARAPDVQAAPAPSDITSNLAARISALSNRLSAPSTSQPVLAAATNGTPAPAPSMPATRTAGTNRAAEPGEPPAVPVQVVRVELEPEPKIPVDVIETAVPATNSETRLAFRRAAEEPAAPRNVAPPKENVPRKEGVLERLKWANPTRWFKNDQPKPPPPPSVRAPSVSATGPPPAKEIEPAGDPPVKTAARYSYRTNLVFPAGNRALAERRFTEAVEAHRRKRLDEAIKGYRATIEADSSFFDAQYNLGLAALQKQDWPLALAATEQAAALRPKSREARYNFAIALREARYYLDALEELRRLLADSGDDARAHLALANLHAQLDQTGLARQHYLKVLELEPRHPEAPAIRQWLANTP